MGSIAPRRTCVGSSSEPGSPTSGRTTVCGTSRILRPWPNVRRTWRHWKKGEEGALDLCHLDEAGFALTLPTNSSWGPRGQRLTVRYEAAQNRRVNVIGAYFTHGPAAGTFCFESYARLPTGRKKGLGKTGRPRRHFRGQSAA